jgi:LDH2 family malate/lactate/ureidoglycolate dehydrogenase
MAASTLGMSAAERVLIKYDDLLDFAVRCLVAAGSDATNAAQVAEVGACFDRWSTGAVCCATVFLTACACACGVAVSSSALFQVCVAADVRGITSHGVNRLGACEEDQRH